MGRQEILSQVEQAFGSVPGFMTDMPDAALTQYWTTLSWVLSDTKLSGRDKALVAFGAASATHCGYGVPFHSAQFALNGMGEEHVKEASWVVQSVVGSSSYLYGVDYSTDQFKQEVATIVAHIEQSAQSE